MKVHLHKHLFLRLSVLFVLCVLFFLSPQFLTEKTSLAVPVAYASHCGGDILGHPGGTGFPCPVKLTPNPVDKEIKTGDLTGTDSSITTPVIDGTSGFMYNTSIGLGGFIVAIGGNLFDGAVEHFIKGLGKFYNGQLGGVVNLLWEIIRDVFNILFIFSLVYIGLRTILDSEDSGTKKLLGLLIAAALLINFSLYFTQVIVDVSNFTAVTIYNSTVKSITGSFQIITNDETTFSIAEGSIAGAFMEVVDLASWFNTKFDTETDSGVFVGSILMLIFLSFTGFVFAYGALMIFARFIAITIYMVFSPLMFLGWIVPQWKKYGTKWWKGFLAYSFYAPAFVFMLYLALYSLIQIKTGLDITNGDGNGYSQYIVSGDKTYFNSFILYAVGIGFMFAAFRVAKIMSEVGAGTSMMFADKVSRRLTTGAGAYVGGYGANAIVGGLGGGALKGVADAIDRRTGWTNPVTRGLRAGGENLQSRKIGGAPSIRETRDAHKAGQKHATSLHSQRNVMQALKLPDTPANKIKKEKAITELSTSEVVAMASTSSGAKILKENAHILRPDHIKALSEDKELNKTTVKDILSGRQSKTNTLFPDGQSAKKANADELASLGIETLTQRAYAVNLTEAKIDKLPSPQFVASEKQAIKKAREDAFIDIVTNNASHGGIDRDVLINSSHDDLALLPKEVFDSNNGANTEAFIQALPLDSLPLISRKKGRGVARAIRGVLENFATANGAPRQRAARDWLDNNRLGQTFGL